MPSHFLWKWKKLVSIVFQFFAFCFGNILLHHFLHSLIIIFFLINFLVHITLFAALFYPNTGSLFYLLQNLKFIHFRFVSCPKFLHIWSAPVFKFFQFSFISLDTSLSVTLSSVSFWNCIACFVCFSIPLYISKPLLYYFLTFGFCSNNDCFVI